MKKGIVIAGLSLFAALLFCGGDNEEAQTEIAPDTVAVEVMVLEAETYVERGDYYGRIIADKEAHLVCFAGGRVEKIAVEEGARVRAGQSLASIDSEEAKTARETARINEQVAKRTWDRTKKHVEEGTASQIALDQAHLAWLTAKSRLLDAEKMWRGALCITPIGGVVTARYIRAHQELAPGSPTFSVARTTDMVVIFGLPEQEMAGVMEGNRAVLTIDVLPGRSWEGSVRRLAHRIDPESRTVSVEIEVPNTDGAIAPGMTGRILLDRRTFENRIVIPSSAVLVRDREPYVVVIEEDIAKFRTVETGVSDSSRTVIENGLTEGMQLCVSGQSLCADGQPVRIVTTVSGQKEQ